MMLAGALVGTLGCLVQIVGILLVLGQVSEAERLVRETRWLPKWTDGARSRAVRFLLNHRLLRRTIPLEGAGGAVAMGATTGSHATLSTKQVSPPHPRVTNGSMPSSTTSKNWSVKSATPPPTRSRGTPRSVTGSADWSLKSRPSPSVCDNWLSAAVGG